MTLLKNVHDGVAAHSLPFISDDLRGRDFLLYENFQNFEKVLGNKNVSKNTFRFFHKIYNFLEKTSEMIEKYTKRSRNIFEQFYGNFKRISEIRIKFPLLVNK